MVKSFCRRARPWWVGAAALLVAVVLGFSAPTYADAGGNGKGAEKSGVAQAGGAAGGEHGLARGKTEGSPRANGSNKTPQPAGVPSGDPSSPQPLSNADQNSGGANGQCPGGPYCSTRDGSPSLNGNGNGKAVGKPCAGCVGRADNKNPKGQLPNGNDRNAGYECDRNHGIGRSNPAHTGCKQVTPPKPPKPPVPPTPKPPKPPKPPVPHVTPPAPPAPHVTPQAKPTPKVPAVAPAQAPRAAAQVPPAAAVAPAAAALPPTGATPLETALAVGGGVVLLSGLVLLLRRRTG